VKRPNHPLKQKKKSKSGTTPYPRGASASAPPKGRKEGGQRRATREEGGKERGRKQLCTRPAANTRSPVGTAASATDAPTKTYTQEILDPPFSEKKSNGVKSVNKVGVTLPTQGIMFRKKTRQRRSANISPKEAPMRELCHACGHEEQA
jgi:hypothetical protein